MEWNSSDSREQILQRGSEHDAEFTQEVLTLVDTLDSWYEANGEVHSFKTVQKYSLEHIATALLILSINFKESQEFYERLSYEGKALVATQIFGAIGQEAASAGS